MAMKGLERSKKGLPVWAVPDESGGNSVLSLLSNEDSGCPKGEWVLNPNNENQDYEDQNKSERV